MKIPIPMSEAPDRDKALLALRAVVPYAESRAEDMNEAAAEPHDCIEDHPDQVKEFGTCLQLAEKARAAVDHAKALLAGSDVARGDFAAKSLRYGRNMAASVIDHRSKGATRNVEAHLSEGEIGSLITRAFSDGRLQGINEAREASGFDELKKAVQNLAALYPGDQIAGMAEIHAALAKTRTSKLLPKLQTNEDAKRAFDGAIGRGGA